MGGALDVILYEVAELEEELLSLVDDAEEVAEEIKSRGVLFHVGFNK